ncbi:MAG: carboxypeptidase-like regulatory domain-containing protein [Longimicrobiales bacterium]
MMRRAVGAILALALIACELFEEECSLNIANNMNLTLQDSITGAPVVAEDIMVVTTDGAYSDTVRLSSGPSSPGTVVFVDGERPGTYRVEVTATGYKPWVRDGVRVREDDDGCHVETVELLVRMQRIGST